MKRFDSGRDMVAGCKRAIIWSVLCGLTLVMAATSSRCAAQEPVLASPNGQVVIHFAIKDMGKDAKAPVYSVEYQGRPLIDESRLGLVLAKEEKLDHGFELVNTTRSENDTHWKPVYGERSDIPDRYRQMVVRLRQVESPQRQLELTFRAYDEGAALRYTLPEQENLADFEIASEQTQFIVVRNYENTYNKRPTGDHLAYVTNESQGLYRRVPLSEAGRQIERPLTIEVYDGPCIAITEAGLNDYSRMWLAVTGINTVTTAIEGPVQGSAPFSTPWRVILIGDQPGDLIERDYLILNLNAPCAIEDTAWIRPGKIFRDLLINTESLKKAVDFCVDRGMQHVIVTAGWYGHEFSGESDARTATPDKWKLQSMQKWLGLEVTDPKPLDLPEVIAYAKEHGIGVWVYVNRLELERRLDELLPLYEQWGIKGIKFGFVQTGPQKWTVWLRDAIRKCAEHHIMVNAHDEFRPTGFARTYPNFMTMEGIRGSELSPPAHHDATLPFTRFLGGPGDYTLRYFKKHPGATHAHQLALAVVFYSPIQYLFWYDLPSDYQGEPELEFWKQVPTVWDETRVLDGRIGEYVAIARRHGDAWFIGAINARYPVELALSLDFLTQGRRYKAKIYADDPSVDTRTHVSVSEQRVDSAMVLHAELKPNSGQAIWIYPEQ
jgi:alpha-glucosidase